MNYMVVSKQEWWSTYKLLDASMYVLFNAIMYQYCFWSSWVKDACSEIFGKWLFFKLADMVTFPTKTSSHGEKLQICISFVSNLRKQCLCYLLFYKWWEPRFLISKRVFRWFLRNYTDFAHKISHIKPSKYGSTFGTKISMRLWIGT